MIFYGLSTLLLLQLGSPTHAFIQPLNNNVRHPVSVHAIAQDDSAKLMTDYMAKSHEEKLKAIKDMELKKNAEIESLKEELKNSQASSSLTVAEPAAAAPAPIVEGSTEELSAKLLAYQNFMSKYIVKAQEDKYNAVKAAEAAVSKKYEDKLNAFMLSGAEEPAPLATVQETKLYDERNANIAAAAKAGKSRWGNKEVEKAGGVSGVSADTAKSPEVASPAPDAISAADHGLRADGGVTGLSLEERITSGAGGSSLNGAAAPAASLSAFDARNAFIAKASKAGLQTRWGIMEEQKSIEFASNPLPAAAAPKEIVASAEVIAADHGLRADGGVSGPSLAERVNLGATLLG